MSFFKGRENGWLIAMVCGLAWVLILSFTLSCLFGAKFSSGWIVAGTMFSIASFCGVLIIREITEAILSFALIQSTGRDRGPNRGTPPVDKSRPSVTEGPGILAYSSFSGSRRTALGLRSDKLSNNRHKKPVKHRFGTSKSQLPDKDFDRPSLGYTSQFNQRFS